MISNYILQMYSTRLLHHSYLHKFFNIMIKLRCESLFTSHFDHKSFLIMSPYHSIVACNENYKNIIVFLNLHHTMETPKNKDTRGSY